MTAAAPHGTSQSQDVDAEAPVAEAHDWDAFVAASDPGSYLQLTGWAAVKAVNGWAAVRIEEPDARGGRVGAQVLVRRPAPLPWGFAYAPRGPVATTWTPAPRPHYTYYRYRYWPR